MRRKAVLLDLAFFIDDVLTHDGVILFDFHLLRRVLLVLVGRVEVTGARGGVQANLVSSALGHGSNPPLNLLATRPQVGENGVDAFLVDDPQALGGDAQFHPTVLTFHPETVAVKVGQEASLTLDV